MIRRKHQEIQTSHASGRETPLARGNRGMPSSPTSGLSRYAYACLAAVFMLALLIGQAPRVTADYTDRSADAGAAGEWVLYERSANADVDQNINHTGKLQVGIDTAPINDPDGKAFQPTALALKESGHGDSIHEMSAAPYRIYFPASLHSPVKLMSQGKRYEFTLEEMSYNAGADHLGDPRPASAKTGAETITYPEAFGQVDVEYQLTTQGFEEFFVLKKRPRAPAGRLPDPTLDFSATIDAGDLRLYVDGVPAPNNFTTEQSIAFVDEAGGATVFSLPAPYAVDAAGKTIPVRYTVQTRGGSVRVHTQTPYAWLDDPQRAYPVRIDPSTTLNATYSIVLRNGTAWESAYISAGSWHNERYRTGIDFNTSAIPDTATITKVELKLTIDDEYGGGVTNNDVGNMTKTAYTYHVTDSDEAGFDADVDGNQYLSNSSGFVGNGTHTVELLSAAATDLQSQLGADSFSVGWTGTTEVGDLGRDGKTYLETPNQPQLIVTYDLAPQYDQDSFRARNDNGDETDSTWRTDPNTGWTQMVDKNFRVRFLIQETTGNAGSDKTFQLEYSLNSGAWTDVTGSSSVVKAAATAYVTDGANTTQQLGSGSFVTPNAGFDEADGAVGGTSLDISGNDEVELEFCLQIVGADVSNGDTIELRIKDLDAYTNTPTVTVTGPGTFSYMKSIEIQETEVTCGSNMTNFPLMVELTGTHFQEVEDDVDSDGFDIIFKAEDDATCGGTGLAPCILDHEIEVYDESNDKLVAWVRIPVLDYDTNTSIYLYYGNSLVNAATENPTGVWESSYVGVWHLNESVTDEGTSGTHEDSTSNGNNGSQAGNATDTGKFSGGQDFDGFNDYISISRDSTLEPSTAITVQAWVNWDNHLASDYGAVVCKPKYEDTAPYVSYSLEQETNLQVVQFTINVNGTLQQTARPTLGLDAWHHLVGTWSSGDYIRLYIDGSEAETSAASYSGSITYFDMPTTIGINQASAPGSAIDAIIDEVRISNVSREACWIDTEHRNHDTPTTFYTVGSQGSPSLTQLHSRWRNDDGGESGSIGWWDDLWSRRKAITIDNTGNTNALTNYQVQVTAAYDSDMLTDFGDIRFANASGTELDYWMQSKTDGVSATFWVEVDSIAASSETTIYVYYGNASVSTTSNAKNTMFIYEDMVSLPTGTLRNNAVYDATNDWVRLTTATNTINGALEYGSSPTPGFVAQWRHWSGGGNGADAVYLYEQATATPTSEDASVNGYIFAADEYNDQLQAKFNNGLLSSWGTTTIDNSQWHDVEIVFYESGGTYYYQFRYDGIQRISSSSTNTPTGSLFGWGARTGGLNNEHRIDDLVVRKYTSPEPGVSLSNEEILTTEASWAADEDTKLVGLDKGIIQRIRFMVYNAGSADADAATFQLQVAQTSTCGSGTYSAVPTDSSGHWQIVDSTYIITDGQATENVSPGLTDPVGGTFIEGQAKDAGNTTSSFNLEAGRFTEIEFSVMATSNALYGADYCFRLYDSTGGQPLNTYSVYATVQVAAPFSFRKAITIDRTQVGCTTMTDFPFLVKITGDNDIKTTANGGHVTNSYGYDIIFRDSDERTTLDHEIEQYNGTNGDLIAWVRIPTLTNTEDKVIYLYYGNSTITSATQNPTGVWDADYSGVWHLEETVTDEATTGIHDDSTSYDRNGSQNGNDDVTGQISNGQQFDGNNDYIGLQNACFAGNNWSLEFWLNPSSPVNYQRQFIQGPTGCTTRQIMSYWYGGHIEVRTATDGAAGNPQAATGTITNSTWSHFVWTYNGTTHTLYVNGQVSTGTTGGTNVGIAGTNNIGRRDAGSYWTGGLDEVRISTIARGACWIQTEYNNQNSPGTFYSVGTEEGNPSTAINLLSFTAKGESGAVLVARYR